MSGDSVVDDAESPPGEAMKRSRTDHWIALGLFAAAVLVRLTETVSSGGVQALYGYDDGVYYSASVGFVNGLMPYRDFVLLHPPGIVVLGAAPIGLLTAMGWADSDMLAAVRVLFIVLGGLNTVLIFLAGRHLSRVCGVVAAGLYCVWLPVVRVERSILLEPLVILGMLAALAWVPPTTTRSRPRLGWVVLAGVLGGLAVSVKLWAGVPLLVIVVALLLVRQWRRVIVYCVSAGVAAAALVLPFALPAPGTFWSMVVSSQFGRPALATPRLDRVVSILDVTTWPLSTTRTGLSFPTRPFLPLEKGDATIAIDAGRQAALVLVAVIAVITLIVVIRVASARVWVALLVVQAAVLLAVPVFFVGYSSFAAPALLLVMGAFGHVLWTARWSVAWLRVGLVGVWAAAVAGLGWGAALTSLGEVMPGGIRTTVAKARCVASDSMTALAVVDRTTRNFRNGCMPVVDYSGVVYVLDYPKASLPNPAQLREVSPEFQGFAVSYFGQSEYVILRRPTGAGLDEESLRTIKARPRLVPPPPVALFGPWPGIEARAVDRPSRSR